MNSDKRLDQTEAKLAAHDRRFDSIDEKLASHDSQFDRLITVMLQRFDRVEKILETKADKADLDRLTGLVDSLAKRQETCDIERLATGHQINRMQDWIEQAAKHYGLKFVH